MDAYTLRKIAPRILIGVIGINLSIYLCVASIDITNAIGRGLADLLTAPFDLESVGLDTGASTVAGIMGILVGLIGGAYAFIAIGPGLLGIGLLLILTIMLIVLSIMITLVIRQTLLVVLTIISPVAIACFILPGTEKYFRMWWENYVKALVVYPIIAALFAISGIMATVSFSSSSTPETSNLAGAFNIITGLILVFIPLFLIPWSFKFAGGIMGSVGNAVMNASAGTRQSLARKRGQIAQEHRAKNMEKLKSGQRFSNSNRFGRRANRALQTGSLLGETVKGNPLRARSRIQAKRDSRSISDVQRLQESEAWKAIQSDDDLTFAASHARSRNEIEQVLRQSGSGVYTNATRSEMDRAVSRVQSAQAEGSLASLQEASIAARAASGTGFTTSGDMMEEINAVSGDDRQRARRLLGTAKSASAQGRRYDISEAGFIPMMDTLNQMHAGGLTSQQATRTINQEAINSRGGAAVVAGRRQSTEQLAPIMFERLQTAIASGDRDQVAKALAETANTYDTVSSTSPENAEVFRTEVLGQTITEPGTGRVISVQQAIEANRGQADFQEYRREHQQAAASQIAQLQAGAQAAQNPQGGFQPPPVNPPI